MENKQVSVEGLEGGVEQASRNDSVAGDGGGDIPGESLEQVFIRMLEQHEFALIGLEAQMADLRGRVELLLEIANGR